MGKTEPARKAMTSPINIMRFRSAAKAAHAPTLRAAARARESATRLVNHVQVLVHTSELAIDLLERMAHQFRTRPAHGAESPRAAVPTLRTPTARAVNADQRRQLAALRRTVRTRIDGLSAEDLAAADRFTADLARKHGAA